MHFENKLKHLESEVSEYHAVVGELKSAVRELLPKKEGHPNNPFKTSKNDILKGLQDPKKSAEFAEDDQMKCSLQMDSVPHSNIQVIYIKQFYDIQFEQFLSNAYFYLDVRRLR